MRGKRGCSTNTCIAISMLLTSSPGLRLAIGMPRTSWEALSSHQSPNIIPNHVPQGFPPWDPQAAVPSLRLPLTGLSALEPPTSFCGALSGGKLVNSKTQRCWAVLQGKYFSSTNGCIQLCVRVCMHVTVSFLHACIHSLLTNSFAIFVLYCPCCHSLALWIIIE